MTTSEAAFGVIRTRLDANKPTWNSVQLSVRWPNETSALPDTPAPFVYVEWATDPADLAAAGGVTNNLWRHRGRIIAYVFVPLGLGAAAALNICDQVAGVFRSYRDTDISCFSATVYPGSEGVRLKPAGLDSAVTSYWGALVEIEMFYDLIG